jgi:hypothetical protein
MLVSLNVKMAIIRLTCQPKIMISVLEMTVVSPVILSGRSQVFPKFMRYFQCIANSTLKKQLQDVVVCHFFYIMGDS